MVTSVGIAGFGTIGKAVAVHLLQPGSPFELKAVTTRSVDKARGQLQEMGSSAEVTSPEGLAAQCDVIVECAPTEAFMSIAEPAMRAGRTMVTVSSAALCENMEVIELAKEKGGRIVLGTGALLGLDAVRAAAKGTIHSVTMITRKPPKSLKGAPYLRDHQIAIDGLSEPLKLFDGAVREGARGFPANLNVAASLALAGIGLDRTRLQIWADPGLDRNTHTIEVDSDSARFSMKIENIPSLEKPGTGRITALSVIAALESLVSPLRVGT